MQWFEEITRRHGVKYLKVGERDDDKDGYNDLDRILGGSFGQPAKHGSGNGELTAFSGAGGGLWRW